jgi:hypothetical protein
MKNNMHKYVKYYADMQSDSTRSIFCILCIFYVLAVCTITTTCVATWPSRQRTSQHGNHDNICSSVVITIQFSVLNHNCINEILLAHFSATAVHLSGPHPDTLCLQIRYLNHFFGYNFIFMLVHIYLPECILQSCINLPC